MIVYSSTKKGFLDDVLSGSVEDKIQASFVNEMGYATNRKEFISWRNSMPYMSNVINDTEIPDDAGVAIEYKIPQTSKRIDFILTGLNSEDKKTAILIELKQWEDSELTDLDGIVKTFVGGNTRQVSHPSYQVWSYATLLEDYNGNVQSSDISMVPCAYLHNYIPDDNINNDFYKEYTDKAPLFLRNDALKLRSFIKKYVKYGDKGDIMYAIENGKIRPSKALADSLSSMLQGNSEFVLIDEQKLVYETALKLAKESSKESKNILIVEGGPGTGKSVVAINLLTELTKQGKVAKYITRNSAPREVYQVKLTGSFTKTRIANLFGSSGSFHDAEANSFDCLIVDEAHRLNEKSGLYGNIGENQVKELIQASKSTIFFIDEDQRISVKDIGKKSTISGWGKRLGVNVHKLELASQFRCNGSDGYLSWLDNTLQIKETANETLDDINYDFQVFDNPLDLHNAITTKNHLNNKSRMVAGYCWQWISKKNPSLKDIVIGDYSATWNLSTHGQAWIVHPESVKEVGCIHTCQGLELDYVGVIIGPDLIVRNGEVITDFLKRALSDQSIKGLKSKRKTNLDEANKIADMIIKNTYRTLMTRGMKGCFIYCTDTETQEYFRQKFSSTINKNLLYGAIDSGISFNTDI